MVIAMTTGSKVHEASGEAARGANTSRHCGDVVTERCSAVTRAPAACRFDARPPPLAPGPARVPGVPCPVGARERAAVRALPGRAAVAAGAGVPALRAAAA